MKYPWLDEYCLSKVGARKDYKLEWEATRYLLGDKMFAMIGANKEGKAIFTFKLEPNHGQLMRAQYAGDITAGYYMNKDHWNSMLLDGSVPDDIVRDLVDSAHRVLLESLPKKVQKELAGS